MKPRLLFIILSLIFGGTLPAAPSFASDSVIPIYAQKYAKKRGKGKRGKGKKVKGGKGSGKKGKQAKRRKGKKKKKKKGLSFGLMGGGGYETLSIQNADVDPVNLAGFAFFGMAAAELPVLDCCSFWGGGGLNIYSGSGEDDTTSYSASLTSIMINGGLRYNIGDALAVGGIFEYLTLMSGNFTSESEDFSSEVKLTAASRMAFGAEGVYRISDALQISGTFLTSLSGSVTTEVPEGVEANAEPVATSSMVFRGGIGFFF